LLFIAGYSDKNKKLILIEKDSIKLDLLKLFLKIFWEIKAINDKKYIAISKHLNEAGKMLGGWIRYFEKNQARKITGLE